MLHLPSFTNTRCLSRAAPFTCLTCASSLSTSFLRLNHFAFTHGFCEFSQTHLFSQSTCLPLPNSSTVVPAKPTIATKANPLIMRPWQPRPQYQNQPYLPNGTNSGPVPGAQALLPNNGRIIQSGPIRVLCIADVRGSLIRLPPRRCTS